MELSPVVEAGWLNISGDGFLQQLFARAEVVDCCVELVLDVAGSGPRAPKGRFQTGFAPGFEPFPSPESEPMVDVNKGSEKMNRVQEWYSLDDVEGVSFDRIRVDKSKMLKHDQTNSGSIYIVVSSLFIS